MKVTIWFNREGWERRAYDCDDEPKMEHYHPALNWCRANKIKYKLKKNLVLNNSYGDDMYDYDPYDVQWSYKIVFNSEHDASTFVNVWGEHI